MSFNKQVGAHKNAKSKFHVLRFSLTFDMLCLNVSLFKNANTFVLQFVLGPIQFDWTIILGYGILGTH